MNFLINAIRFKDPFFRPSESTNFLLSCIGRKVKIEIDFSYEDPFFATEDDFIRFFPSPADVGTLYNPQELVFTNVVGGFSNYEVGDVFVQSGGSQGSGNFTVTEILSGELIRVGGVSFTAEDLPAGGYIANNTPMTAARYSYNFVPSGNSYNSLVDGELQQLQLDGVTTTPAAMSFNGIKSYQIGSAIIKANPTVGVTQLFTITHETVLTPFFLLVQYPELIAGLPPDYYNLANCLNFVCRIELGRNLSDPSALKVVEFNQPGNTGWFGETFNGGATNYNISSFIIKRFSDSALLPALEFDNECVVEIIIDNTTGPFVTGLSKFALNFCYLPDSETYYQNNGRDQRQNFVFDLAEGLTDGPTVYGANNATTLQVITNTDTVMLSATQIKITARINLGTLSKSIISQGDFKRYMLWVNAEKHSLTALTSDKVALLVQVDEFAQILYDTDLIVANTVLIQHPFTDKADGVPDNLDVFPVDDVAARTDFSIDFTDKEDDGILITRVTSQIRLVKTGQPNIKLDEMSVDTSAFPLIGFVPDINYDANRVFKIPAGEIRKVFSVHRDYVADAAPVYKWYHNFPFMVRWEYWVKLPGVTTVPADLFDPTNPFFKGINHFWHRMAAVSGWTLQYYLRFNIQQNGESFTQEFTRTLISHNYGDNPEWINESIKSYNLTGTELLSGGVRFINDFEKTRLVASFEWDGVVAAPPLDDIEITMWIEVKELGGIAGIRRISSVYVFDSQSWFDSIDGSGKVVVATPSAGVYTGEAYVDNTKLPTNKNYTVYARLYHKPTGLACTVTSLYTEDETDCLAFEDIIPWEPE
jgi:hypothetical protein